MYGSYCKRDYPDVYYPSPCPKVHTMSIPESAPRDFKSERPGLNLHSVAEFKDSLLERRAFDIALQAWNIYNDEVLPEIAGGTAFEGQRSFLYRLAATAHSIHEIATNPEAQYRLLYEREDDAFLPPMPVRLNDKDGYKSVWGEDKKGSVRFTFNFDTESVTPEIATKALYKLLSFMGMEHLQEFGDSESAAIDDPQFTDSIPGLTYYKDLTEGMRLKIHIRRQGKQKFIDSKHAGFRFALFLSDPTHAHETRYREVQKEYDLQELDHALNPEELVKAATIEDPNAKKSGHVIVCKMPEGFTRLTVLESLRNRLKSTWMPIIQESDDPDAPIHFESVDAHRLFIEAIGPVREKHNRSYVQISIREGAESYHQRKARRTQQLEEATARMIRHQIGISNQDHPIILTGDKSIHTQPVRAAIQPMSRGRYSSDKIYSRRKFDQQDVQDQVTAQFKILALDELRQQQDQRVYTLKVFAPIEQNIAGRDYTMVYAVVPFLKPDGAPDVRVICWKLRGKPVEIYTGTEKKKKPDTQSRLSFKPNPTSR